MAHSLNRYSVKVTATIKSYIGLQSIEHLQQREQILTRQDKTRTYTVQKNPTCQGKPLFLFICKTNGQNTVTDSIENAIKLNSIPFQMICFVSAEKVTTIFKGKNAQNF